MDPYGQGSLLDLAVAKVQWERKAACRQRKAALTMAPVGVAFLEAT